MTSLEASYKYSRRIARQRAKNFYYAFLLLEKPQRNAMCALYAFMRYCDDLSDDVEGGTTPQTMQQWRTDMAAALNGKFNDHPVWPAFHDTVIRYRIPHEYFHHMIDGVSSDLMPRKIETFDELYRYCYQVASVVGLCIVHIFGFTDPQALVLAEKCGVAFQLTNIIRDVREDFELGRRYIPLEDLQKFGADSRKIEKSTGWVQTLGHEANHARAYYNEARPLIGMVDNKSRRSMWALIEIYWRLFQKIEASGFAVFDHRIRLTTFQKLRILAEAGFRPTE